jgi:inorganic pyrophosphatase
VPVTELHPYHAKVAAHGDLPRILTDQIEHFFQHYKDLEEGKWVKVDGWKDADFAREIIVKAIEAEKQKNG